MPSPRIRPASCRRSSPDGSPARRAATLAPSLLAGPVLALALAGCGTGDAAPAAAGDTPQLEIAVERPVGPPGAFASEAARDPAAPTSLVPRLAVRDVAASAAFYRDLFGFVPEGGPPAAGDPRAVLRRGPMRIALESAAGGAPPADDAPPIALVFTTVDAASLFDRLADQAPLLRGLRDTDHGTREFAVADPDGHTLVISQNL